LVQYGWLDEQLGTHCRPGTILPPVQEDTLLQMKFPGQLDVQAWPALEEIKRVASRMGRALLMVTAVEVVDEMELGPERWSIFVTLEEMLGRGETEGGELAAADEFPPAVDA